MKSSEACFYMAVQCERMASACADEKSRHALLAAAVHWRTLGRAAAGQIRPSKGQKNFRASKRTDWRSRTNLGAADQALNDAYRLMAFLDAIAIHLPRNTDA
jgi:hypothetical protein